MLGYLLFVLVLAFRPGDTIIQLTAVKGTDMPANLSESLYRFLDFIYGRASNISATGAKLAMMYILGLIALVVISIVLEVLLRIIRILVALAFDEYGGRGSLEIIDFSARLYCSVQRILWRVGPTGFWGRLLRWRPLPLILRIPLNIILHALSFTISNILIWASIFVYLRAHLPTYQTALQAYDFAKDIEIGKILAWLSLVLVLIFLQRGAVLRARIRHEEEDSYVDAIKLGSGLEAPLRRIAYNCRENLPLLLLDSRTRFPRLFVARVLGSTDWTYSPGTKTLRAPHQWEKVEIEDLSSFQHYNEVDGLLKEIFDLSLNLRKQALWPRFNRLLSSVSWELSQLNLENGAAAVDLGFSDEKQTLEA